MAGHSKWSQIKHKKAKEDAKRGKAFTKLIKEIIVAARLGGGDPAGNARLRLLVEKAKEINMPQENTIRAIKKGTGELPGTHYEEHTYEGYGPHGIAIIVQVLTDNKNRAVAALRHLFSAKGGSLGASGSVSWLFEHLGVIRAGQNDVSEDALFDALIDFDIKDISAQEGLATITCDARALMQVRETVAQLGLNIESAELEWVAKELINLEEKASNNVYAFLEAIEDHEDVQHVFTNVA